jgi:lipopolysaccharide exporter
VEEKVIRGVPWMLLTYGLQRLLTWPTTILLARLLDPADFGVVALAILAVQLLGVVSELGLESTLVVRQDLDRRGQGTLMSMMLAAGALMGAALAALAPLVARLFHEPRLSAVLAAMAVTLVLSGFTWCYEGLLQRELEFRKRFLSQFVQAATYVTVALALAVAGAGVWSLVLGQLVSTLAYGAALVSLAPYRLRPTLDAAVARQAVATGKGFMAQAGLAFLRENADYVAVGRLLGSGPLGIYSMGYRLAEHPSWAVADSVSRVTFPGFARMRSREEEVAPAFLSTLELVALLTCPLGIMLSAAAGPITRTFFGAKWLPMAGVLAVLGIWGALRPLQVTLGWFLNAIGAAGDEARVAAGLAAALIPAAFLAAATGGIVAVAWLVVAEAVLSAVLFARLASRRGAVSWRRQLEAVLPVLALAPPAWVAGRLAASVPTSRAVLSLALSVGVVLAMYAAGMWLFSRELLRRGIQQAARALGRGAVLSGRGGSVSPDPG